MYTFIQLPCYSMLSFLPHTYMNFKGRVHVKIASRKRNKDSTREERRKKANQLRTKKREEVIQKKRAIGGHDTAPFLTAIIPLGVSANIEGLLKQFKNCDPDSKIITTSRDVLHIRYNSVYHTIIIENYKLHMLVLLVCLGFISPTV